jgi:hypothetical protein
MSGIVSLQHPKKQVALTELDFLQCFGYEQIAPGFSGSCEMFKWNIKTDLIPDDS